MAAMIATAIALAAIPAAAVAWIATLTGAFCLAYYFGGATLDPKVGAHLHAGRRRRRVQRRRG